MNISNDTNDMIKINIDKGGKVNTINVSYVYNFDDTFPPIVIPFKENEEVHELDEKEVLSAIKICYENINTRNLADAIKSLGKFELKYTLASIPSTFKGIFNYVDSKQIKQSDKYLLVVVLQSIAEDALIPLALFIHIGNKQYISKYFKEIS